MKKHLPFITLLLLLPLALWSQTSIGVNPATFVMSGHPSNNDVSYHIEVTNTSGLDAYILWSRVVESAPAGWLTWICDKNVCYLPTADACAPNKPNVLAPGEKMDFQIHVNPASIEGSTSYEITFTDYENPSVILGKVQGEVIISTTVSTQTQSQQSTLTVYPNPTADYFQVSNTPGLRHIELFNILGNKMKSFDAVPQKQYFIGDLNEGIYLVRLTSSSGKVLKTVRLSKR